MKTLKKQYNIYRLDDTGKSESANYRTYDRKRLVEWKTGFESLEEAEAYVATLDEYEEWAILAVYRFAY